MKHILQLISSPNKTNSYSIKLSNAIVDKLLEAFPASMVHTRDLTSTQFPHLEESQITSFFTPKEFRTPANEEAIRHSDEAIAEVTNADILVIGVPMYNFGISSTLKAWIDHVIRVGVTFRILEDGSYQSLVHGKKAYLAISTGGIYSDGPMKPYDFTETYLRTILGFIGITDITAIRVEGTAIPGMAEQALQKAISSITISSEAAISA